MRRTPASPSRVCIKAIVCLQVGAKEFLCNGVCRQKRAHNTLTIDKKLELLAQIGKKSYIALCETYGVGRFTISDLKKQEPALRAYKRRMKDLGVKLPSAKIMKLGKDEHLETALYIWFKQKREEGVPITGSIIRAKALDLHRQLHSHSDETEGDGSVVDSAFTASTGWIWRFGKRHNIRTAVLARRETFSRPTSRRSICPRISSPYCREWLFSRSSIQLR